MLKTLNGFRSTGCREGKTCKKIGLEAHIVLEDPSWVGYALERDRRSAQIKTCDMEDDLIDLWAWFRSM